MSRPRGRNRNVPSQPNKKNEIETDLQSDQLNNNERWKTADVLQVISIVATIILSLVSLVLSTSANKNSQATQSTVEASRVETGDVTTNSNDTDLNETWTPWEFPVSTQTTYVGVQKKVRFGRPFQNNPQVMTALKLVNLRSLIDMMHELKYTPKSQNEETRLRELHIVTQTGTITPNGFILQIGVGLPTEAAKHFVTYLQENKIDPEVEAIMRRYRKISPKSQGLSVEERWMINFYSTLGTLDVSWLAQVNEH
jgi:hypothetical protein